MSPEAYGLLGAAIGAVAVLLLGFLRESWEHRRWLRETRHRLYAEWVAAAVPAQQAVEDIVRMVNRARERQVPAQDLLQPAKTAEERFLELRAVYQRLELIASPQLMERAQEITYHADEFPWWVVHGDHGGTIKSESIPWQLVLSAEDVEGFVDAARVELGAEWRFHRRVERARARLTRLWSSRSRVANR